MDVFLELFYETGFPHLDWRMLFMWVVAAGLLYLAVFKKFEPLLLVPIGMGALLANLPTQGIVNRPAGPVVSPVQGTVIAAFVDVGESVELPLVKKNLPSYPLKVWTSEEFDTVLQKLEHADRDYPALLALIRPHGVRAPAEGSLRTVRLRGGSVTVGPDDYWLWATAEGRVTEVHHQPGAVVQKGEPVLTQHSEHGGGLFYYFQLGILLELFPPLIFLGVGALTDFGPLIANPRVLLLGAAAQFGVFATFIGASLLGFGNEAAGAIAIIGGADGPTSIFLANALAPELLAPIAVAAYSYMALVPVIQPPIMRTLTTQRERRIRMQSLRKVGRLERLVFGLVVMTTCILLVPPASPLIFMLFLGNFLRESGVTERLAKAAQNELINVVTILLGISVGITMTGDTFIRAETLKILALGILAFGIATASGVLMAKLMNLFSRNKINPLIGSAGVSAVPMAARVSQVEGQREDPNNYLLMHAMGPNVAGVIGTALVAGYFLTVLS